ncbi:MAG: hypothetical protein MR727_02725 [Lentisphaeria bacterium]|nr:hypothetical protein [Lentisphaeria bacterium]
MRRALGRIFPKQTENGSISARERRPVVETGKIPVKFPELGTFPDWESITWFRIPLLQGFYAPPRKKPRVWHADSLKGREFVQFIGLGYLCFFAKKIKAVRQKLDEREGLSQAEISMNKKLAQWIDSHSIAQIFDWFDCIETTTIKTKAGNIRWSTESIARGANFKSFGSCLFIIRFFASKPFLMLRVRFFS